VLTLSRVVDGPNRAVPLNGFELSGRGTSLRRPRFSPHHTPALAQLAASPVRSCGMLGIAKSCMQPNSRISPRKIHFNGFSIWKSVANFRI